MDESTRLWKAYIFQSWGSAPVMKKVKDFEKAVGFQIEIIILSSGMIEVRPESIIGNGAIFFGIDTELLCYELELHMRIFKYRC